MLTIANIIQKGLSDLINKVYSLRQDKYDLWFFESLIKSGIETQLSNKCDCYMNGKGDFFEDFGECEHEFIEGSFILVDNTNITPYTGREVKRCIKCKKLISNLMLPLSPIEEG